MNQSISLHNIEIDRSQDAFRALTERYIDMVYSAACRQVGDAHLAEDVTQAVFIILAQKFKSLPRDRPIGAWLLKTTGYVAANARRRRALREYHERKAVEMIHQMNQQSNPDRDSEWGQLWPLLDEGLNNLRTMDRE